MTECSFSKFCRSFWVPVLVLALPLAACGEDDLTGPTAQEGTLETLIQDGAPAESPAAVMGVNGQGHDVEGEFRGDLRFQVQVDGAWLDLAGITEVTASTELQSGERRSAATAQVEARTYERARVVVTNAETHLEAGSVIGTDVIDTLVSLSIGGGSELVVELSAPLTVEADATTQVVLELNSRSWLTGSSTEAGAVSATAFETAAELWVD
jgi:hypothetical protein